MAASILRTSAFGAADHLSEALRAVFRGGLAELNVGPEFENFRGTGAGSARVESDEITNYPANLRLTFITRLLAEPVALK